MLSLNIDHLKNDYISYFVNKVHKTVVNEKNETCGRVLRSLDGRCRSVLQSLFFQRPGVLKAIREG